MSLTWLTIDCDDIRHIPKHHGHPTRTKSPIASSELSPAFKSGMKGFEEWLESHDKPVTLFVIADSLEDEEFSNWLTTIIEKFTHRVTIGCHGLDHKSWSAWPENPDLFKNAEKDAINIGTTIQTSEGINKYVINFRVVTLLAIHNIVVVTSPIGDHAPPAFADTIIRPANQSLVFLSEITFCKIVTNTIVAVKLSIIADKINAKIANIHKRFFLDFVLIKFLIVAKPLK